jgi:Mor family transcriptional regulator
MLQNKIDFKQFAIDWQRGTQVSDIAKKYKLTNAEASRVAGVMRKKGVDLKKFRIGVQVDLDADEINKAIARLK